jgi:hypothetical protein
MKANERAMFKPDLRVERVGCPLFLTGEMTRNVGSRYKTGFAAAKTLIY